MRAGGKITSRKLLTKRVPRVNLNGMKIVVFDCETTGLPVKGSDMDVAQPWAVQLGAVSLDDKLQITAQLNTLVIPPEGAVWSEKAMLMHGITPEIVAANGRSTVEVLEEFRKILKGADMYAAYNLPYDEKIIKTSGNRVGCGDVFPPEAQGQCIMQWVAAEYGGARMRLERAYNLITGKKIENAHDAFADTLAAIEVFRILALRD